MAKFPTMKAGKKDYEAPLAEFDVLAAERKSGARFDPDGVRKVKDLLAKAALAALTDARAKTGVVAGSLVFRIKYAGGKHYGPGDVVLVTGYTDATKAPKVSAKAKNQGELRVWPSKNVLSRDWWTATVVERDPTPLADALGRYEIALSALDNGRTVAEVDELQDALRAVERGLKAARTRFPAKNDQAILDKLEAGLRAAQKAVSSDMSIHASTIREAREAVIHDVNAQLVGVVEELDRCARAAEDAIRAGDPEAVDAALAAADRELEVARRQIADGYVLRERNHHAARLGLLPTDVPIDDALAIVRRAEPAYQEATRRLEAVRERASEAFRGGEGLSDVKRLLAGVQEMVAVTKDMELWLTRAQGLAEGACHGTNHNKSFEQILEQLEGQLASWHRAYDNMVRLAGPQIDDTPNGRAAAKIQPALDELVPRIERIEGEHARLAQLPALLPGIALGWLESREVVVEALRELLAGAKAQIEAREAGDDTVDLNSIRRALFAIRQRIDVEFAATVPKITTGPGAGIQDLFIDLVMVSVLSKLKHSALSRARAASSFIRGREDEAGSASEMYVRLKERYGALVGEAG